MFMWSLHICSSLPQANILPYLAISKISYQVFNPTLVSI